MHAKHPEIAARWDEKYGGQIVKKTKKKKKKNDYRNGYLSHY